MKLTAEDLSKLKFSCIICGEMIPIERAVRKSNTCGKEHQQRLAAIRRAMVDARRCRICHRPSTPQERVDFQKWRKAQPDYTPKKRGRPKKLNQTEDQNVASPTASAGDREPEKTS